MLSLRRILREADMGTWVAYRTAAREILHGPPAVQHDATIVELESR